MTGMVERQGEGELLMTVADERKTVLERGQQRFVTAVNVTILGGGMKEILYAKVIRSCVAVLRAENGEDGHMAMRTLLRVIPALSGLVRSGRGC